MNAALAPILVLAVAIGIEIYCLVDLARVEDVRYLPKWGWLVVSLVSIPLGGIIYLIVGRAP
jgi:hypothetical protein